VRIVFDSRLGMTSKPPTQAVPAGEEKWISRTLQGLGVDTHTKAVLQILAAALAGRRHFPDSRQIQLHP
jgi:hypothetical protein